MNHVRGIKILELSEFVFSGGRGGMELGESKAKFLLFEFRGLPVLRGYNYLGCIVFMKLKAAV